MRKDYWVQYWENKTSNLEGLSEQEQVLRTRNKQPIRPEQWEFTLSDLNNHMNVGQEDYVLDLCAGNGLFSRHFTSKGAKVVAVDISQNLLSNIEEDTGIKTIKKDIREIQFKPYTFNKIFLYAGIQYLSEEEAVKLFVDMYEWLRPKGQLFIGDIPDDEKKWTFYNTEERKAVYFKNILEGSSIVGTWFDKSWLLNLAEYSGFKNCKVIKQKERLIYSNFRFDFSCTK